MEETAPLLAASPLEADDPLPESLSGGAAMTARKLSPRGLPPPALAPHAALFPGGRRTLSVVCLRCRRTTSTSQSAVRPHTRFLTGSSRTPCNWADGQLRPTASRSTGEGGENCYGAECLAGSASRARLPRDWDHSAPRERDERDSELLALGHVRARSIVPRATKTSARWGTRPCAPAANSRGTDAWLQHAQRRCAAAAGPSSQSRWHHGGTAYGDRQGKDPAPSRRLARMGCATGVRNRIHQSEIRHRRSDVGAACLGSGGLRGRGQALGAILHPSRPARRRHRCALCGPPRRSPMGAKLWRQ